MPKIKIDHIVSFSSEDPVHVANNILNTDNNKKWKCQNPGEKNPTIILQFEKASVISSIDIGNEHSAYVEVLVSRSGSSSEDFKGFLVMSMFMSPLEARQSTNVNKVRMFTKEDFLKPECDEKWDRVKIVCSQPFNRRVQYGLSFINFNSPDGTETPTTAPTLGRFTLRPESPTSFTGSLFSKRKDKPLSAAAAIREASSLTPARNKVTITPKNSPAAVKNDESTKPLARNRNELLYDKDEEEPHEKIDKIIRDKAKEKEEKEDKDKEVKAGSSRESTKRKSRSTKEKHSPKKKLKPDHIRKPFGKLLQGVTLVISGIQNPDRADLRAKALEMGAKYKPDWDKSCTHLICAFANTPKFNQVRGKGKIVKKDWIEDCHSQRKKLPWRRFCLDKNDKNKPESEDEIWEEIKENTPPPKVVTNQDSTDDEGFDDTEMQKRIEEIQARDKVNGGKTDVFLLDTDEESDAKTDDIQFSNVLPDFFDLKTFFIDEMLDEDVVKQLERYIIAYKGIISENPTTDVDYLLSTENASFELKIAAPNAKFVRPDWIWDCHNNKKLVSLDEYTL